MLAFAQGWFPSGPLTTIYAWLLIASVVLCLWKGRDDIKTVAMLMFASWILARTGTRLYDMQILGGQATALVQGVGTFFIALALFRVKTTAGNVIALLAGAKLCVYGLFVFNLLYWETMWAWSEVAAYIQIIAMTIGGWHGGMALFRGRWPVYRGGLRLLAMRALRRDHMESS